MRIILIDVFYDLQVQTKRKKNGQIALIFLIIY